ncbi:MAG TPA: formylglycine-generating enzyme family protein [Opitutaceae bacterium]|nr:formylglycine-generating enzyme family protein [Opitutaceae bacterium]
MKTLPAALLFLGAIAGSLAFGAPGTETIDLGGGVKMEFVLIPAGSFTMGSARNSYDEKPVHQVTLTQSYHLGKFEVSQEQWEKVMGGNPSHFKGAKLPVENVSWEDCQRFLAELRKKTGRQFALPTEAQWEYACRAGTTTTFSCGDDEACLADHSWHSGNSGLTTHPVGQKKPNAWGLHDMHGNVFEWCADWYSESYPDGDAVDPQGPSTGERRTIRGGAWLYVTDNHRSSDRGFSPPDYRINEYGLRCVMLTREAETSSAAAESAAKSDPAAPLLSRLEKALSEANKLHAEYLLTEAEKLVPGDPRLAALRRRIAVLPAPAETLAIEIDPGVAMEFVLIRPGTFTMGSNATPLLNEKPAHAVAITKPFYLGKFEVTQKQWQAIMDRNQSFFKGSEALGDPKQLPVENVSWVLAQSFLAKLNEKFPGRRFRLPTEAEWEYACRADTAGIQSSSDSTLLDTQAWYGGNAGGTTHPVGGKAANAWGLHDMYGNVWEWCQDPFGPYPAGAVQDPTGPTASSSGTRVLRGGAWNNSANHVNATFRYDDGSNILMRYYGFRCVVETAPENK